MREQGAAPKTRRPGQFIVLVMVLFCNLLLVQNSYAETAYKALIILSEDKSPYQQVADAVISLGPAINIETSNTDALKSNTAAQLQRFNLIIPIGSKATALSLKNAAPQSALIATFLPSSTYQQLKQQYSSHISQQQLQLSAVFLDQPYNRQLALARIISPNAESLGVILGPDSSKKFYSLHQAARQQEFNLYSDTFNDEDNPVKRLQPIMNSSDIFLALPDQTIFNRTTAKWLLYMSLRKKVPLIAFSRNYVRSGALAAVISDPAQTGRHTAELITQLATSGALPAPQHSRYFSVVVNRQTARQLQIQIPEQSIIEKMLGEEVHK
ncbi:ABC transporter substrate-binding protein [Amphritea sp. HPY]|uniref:ABC transporter substrate-binding protein n=1 Tax=Amphritea sp. HPY TaxID=3421652 RepID=UPI003D7D288A